MAILHEGLLPLDAFVNREERLKGRDETMPVAKTLDNPESFLNPNPVHNPHIVKRLNHYRAFLWEVWDDDENYCRFPQNIAMDTDNLVMLYADFAEPTVSIKAPKPTGLAVCGFDQGKQVTNSQLSNAGSDVVVIGQYQTVNFPAGEREMMSYLGFLRYKELLTHYIEQFTLWLNSRHGIQFAGVGIAQSMRSDRRMAQCNFENENLTTPTAAQVREKVTAALNERVAFSYNLGYTYLAEVVTERRTPFPTLIKPLSEIKQDQKLFAFLDSQSSYGVS